MLHVVDNNDVIGKSDYASNACSGTCI